MVPTGAAASPDVLNSWKEIAAYLDRDVRTVMRWEQARGLPVHRLPGGPKSAVYALRHELDAWRKGRKLALIEEPVPRRPPAARTVVLALAAASLVVAAAVAAWWLAHRPAGMPSQMTRLTYEPRVGSWPAISADGRLFAYTSDREGAFDIYVQQMGGHQPVRVTRDEADDWQPSLSPDGSHIAFRSEREGGGIFLTETLGGIERKIADGGSHPAFSPDGATIAYLVRNAFTERARMFLIPAGGGVPRPFQPEFELSPVANVYSGPLWSPDGQHILFEGMRGGDVRTHGLWVAPAGGGPAMQVGQVPPIPFGVIRFYVAW